MSTTKDIIHKSLNELKSKKDECEAELRGIESAITSFEGILLDMGEKASTKYQHPLREVGRTDMGVGEVTKKRTKKITEKEVRDAVIKVGKKPPATGVGTHSFKIGFFSVSHICEEMGLHRTNPKVRKFVDKFEQKGMLESAVYKNGKQYRYLDPAASGPGRAAQIDISTPISGGVTRAESSPVPGTGNGSKIHVSNKDVEQMLRAAQRQGFTVTHQGDGHKRVSKGSGQPYVSLSGTSTRSAQRVKIELEEIGVKL